jgi:hypothetical protein
VSDDLEVKGEEERIKHTCGCAKLLITSTYIENWLCPLVTISKTSDCSTQYFFVYIIYNRNKFHVVKVKVKLSRYRPGQALGVQEVEVPEFLDSRHMKVVRLSSLHNSCLYPQESFT